MAKLGINTGSIPNDGTGDTLLAAALKINQNFDEIYSTLGDGSNLSGVVTSLVGYATTEYVNSSLVGYATTELLDSVVSSIPTFDQDLSTVNDVTFNRLGITTGEINVGYNNSLLINVDDAESGVSTYTFDTVGNLTIPGNIYIDGNSGYVLFNNGGSKIQAEPTNDFEIHVGGFNNKVTGFGTDGSLTVPGTITLANGLKLADSGSGLPGNFGFIGDETTDVLYLQGQNGVVLTFPDGLDEPDSFLFDASGITFPDSTVQTTAYTGGGLGESYWLSTAAGIHTLSNVGIGTTNPTSALTVVGSGTSTSQLYVTGVSTFRNHIKLGTDDYFYLGDTNQYYLQYNGSSGSRLYSNTTFTLLSDRTIIKNKADLEYMIDCVADAEVALYYNGSKKFETLGTGVTVTGTTFTNQLSVSGVSTFNSTLNGLYLNNATNVKGTSNIAIGENALLNHTFGNNSIAIGYDSLRNASNPNFHNIGIGQYAGRSLTNGVLNTFLGYNSGYDMTGGSGNVIIGSFNGNAYGLDIRDADDYIILSANGQSSTQPRLIVDPNGNIGIGTTNPVDGYNLTLGAPNTGIRTTSLKVYGYADINGLTVKGNSRDYTDNVIITQNPSATFYGNRNVAIGDQSFTTPGAAGENVAIGYYALNSVGNNDGLNTWNGNTAVGAWAGQSATTTLRNTFIGNGSGRYITTGGENTILGSYDGNQKGLDIRTSSNNIVLSDGAGNIRFYANSSGNVGLGTTNPTVKLEVNGSVRVGVDTSAGVILTSPNGTKYQLFVENDGTLKTVAV